MTLLMASNETYTTRVGEIKCIPIDIWDRLELRNGIDVRPRSSKLSYHVWTSAWKGQYLLDFSVSRKCDGRFVALYHPLSVSKEVFLAIRNAL